MAMGMRGRRLFDVSDVLWLRTVYIALRQPVNGMCFETCGKWRQLAQWVRTFVTIITDRQTGRQDGDAGPYSLTYSSNTHTRTTGNLTQACVTVTWRHLVYMFKVWREIIQMTLTYIQVIVALVVWWFRFETVVPSVLGTTARNWSKGHRQ